jgi:hypothetical protein
VTLVTFAAFLIGQGERRSANECQPPSMKSDVGLGGVKTIFDEAPTQH